MHRTEREGKIIFSFSCVVFSIFNKLSTNLVALTLFSQETLFVRGIIEKHGSRHFVHCVPIPLSLTLSHTNPNASRSNFAFKSCGLTQRGSFLPHTSSEKRENQKDTKSRLAIQWGENSFRHCCHSMRATVGTHGPCCLCILFASRHDGLCACIMNAFL